MTTRVAAQKAKAFLPGIGRSDQDGWQLLTVLRWGEVGVAGEDRQAVAKWRKVGTRERQLRLHACSCGPRGLCVAWKSCL